MHIPKWRVWICGNSNCTCEDSRKNERKTGRVSTTENGKWLHAWIILLLYYLILIQIIFIVLFRYAPPHPCATWPLTANIADPVRTSIICSGPAQLIQAVKWFEDSAAASSIEHLNCTPDITSGASRPQPGNIGPVLRTKNMFYMSRSMVHNISESRNNTDRTCRETFSVAMWTNLNELLSLRRDSTSLKSQEVLHAWINCFVENKFKWVANLYYACMSRCQTDIVIWNSLFDLLMNMV